MNEPVSQVDRLEDAPRATIQRSHGRAHVDVRATPRGTVLADLYQHANAKIRIPKTYEPTLQAVLVNTAGGIAGGDTLQWTARAAQSAQLLVTTQACERIYGHATQAAHIDNHVEVAAQAFCAWLPQETILYDGAQLRRSLTVDVASDASFIGLESIVLGRAHMGETLTQFDMRDRWLIKRAGVPLYADVLRLDAASVVETGRAGMDAMTVMATLVYVPYADSPPMKAITERIARLAPSGGVHIGASAFDTHLVCRLLAPSSYALRQALPPMLDAIDAQFHLPKIWRF